MPITPIENKCLSRMDKLRHNLTVVENALDKLNRKEISLAQLKETFTSLDHIEQELRAFLNWEFLVLVNKDAFIP